VLRVDKVIFVLMHKLLCISQHSAANNLKHTNDKHSKKLKVRIIRN